MDCGPAGANVDATHDPTKLTKYIVNTDRFERSATPYRAASSCIYKCADGRWFKLHGSLNPDGVLDVLGLLHDHLAASAEEAQAIYREKLSKLPSSQVRGMIADAGECGDICNSFDEYARSEQGQANAHVGLFELRHVPSKFQQPSWWPSTQQTSVARPLPGLKIIELARIIAGPSVCRCLAELGASVIHINSPDIPDIPSLHLDLNWGKWCAYVDLTTAEGRRTLRDLVLEADVVINGYRPGALDKFGFSFTDIIDMLGHRDRGIVSVRLNCYGWYGPSSHRPGWQPVSDAYTGISHGYGQALGLADDEPVSPMFPAADYSTGLVGAIAIISALIQRGEKGGSYQVDLALNYYNQFLARDCGAYPNDVWKELLESTGGLGFRAQHGMEKTATRTLRFLREKGAIREDFFEIRHSGILGVDVHCVKPAIYFPDGEVKLGYNVGVRGNGRDKAKWPADLMTEIVV